MHTDVHVPAALQNDLESLMIAASGSRRLACLDLRGAMFDSAGTGAIILMLEKCAALRELRVSVSCQQDKSRLLLGAARVNPRCLLVVTAPNTSATCENAMAGPACAHSNAHQSTPASEGTVSNQDREALALVPLPSGNAMAPAGLHKRRARSSVAGTSLKSSKQGRREFKQSSGLLKSSSAGGAAQRGAQVFRRADRRGTGCASLRDLSKALKAFKIDGFSSKKVPHMTQIRSCISITPLDPNVCAFEGVLA